MIYRRSAVATNMQGDFLTKQNPFFGRINAQILSFFLGPI